MENLGDGVRWQFSAGLRLITWIFKSPEIKVLQSPEIRGYPGNESPTLGDQLTHKRTRSSRNSILESRI
jgi:hypothetical protein